MKFIYFSDTNVEATKVFSDFDNNQVTTLTSFEQVKQITDLEIIMFVVLENPPTAEFLQWKKEHGQVKVVLLSAKFTDAYLRDLQLEHSFYDLFFRYPISFFEVEKNIRLISPYTSSSWNVNAKNLNEENNKVELSVEDDKTQSDNTGTLVLGNLAEEVTMPPVVEKKESDSELVLPTENKVEDGAFAQMSSALMAQAEKLPEPLPDPLNESLNLNQEKEAPLSVEDEITMTNLMAPEDEGNKKIEEVTELKLNSESEPPQTTDIKSNLEVEAAKQGVSLGEILENKEDQIFRLLSQNNRLKEEVIEKEELIKSLQKDLHQHLGSFEKNKTDIDDTKFQMSIIKNAHDKEKAEIQRNLDNALEKVALLEQRLEEVKKEYLKSSQNQLSSTEIRKIKARQEHLEEKISLLQSDSAMQLQNREKKIIELKRKIDLLEFDLKDSQERERDFKKKIQMAESRLAQMKQVLKQVVDDNVVEETNVEPLKKTGSYDL